MTIIHRFDPKSGHRGGCSDINKGQRCDGGGRVGNPSTVGPRIRPMFRNGSVYGSRNLGRSLIPTLLRSVNTREWSFIRLTWVSTLYVLSEFTQRLPKKSLYSGVVLGRSCGGYRRLGPSRAPKSIKTYKGSRLTFETFLSTYTVSYLVSDSCVIYD